VITAPESALLTLWVSVAPDQRANLGGFAGTRFDLRGLAAWDTGTVDWYSATPQFCNTTFCAGTLQANNDITEIEPFRMPAAFNPSFDFSNPIAICELQWTPHDYTPRTVRFVDANHSTNFVWTDDIGSGAEFDTLSCIPCGVSFGSFEVVGSAAPADDGFDKKLLWVLDWNLDGVSNLRDVTDFTKEWSNGAKRADLQGDQRVNMLDAILFVAVWTSAL
jgi:hypothetical protein